MSDTTHTDQARQAALETGVPSEIAALIGERQYPVTANFPVERA